MLPFFIKMTKKNQNAQDLKGKQGLTRLINAFGYSADGFKAAFCTEQAFRQECYLAMIGIPVAFLLPVSLMQSLALSVSILFLMIVELLNSALEAAIDRIGMEIHPLSKKAKDVASAAVLCACVTCALTWVVILFDACLF